MSTASKIASLSESQIASLKRVGFWWGPYDRDLPDPRDYVDASWDQTERDRGIAYLLQCYQPPYSWRGCSWCRFDCPVTPAEIGTQDRTDGTWVFPEGFVHYIRHHGVKPPEEFLEHIRANKFTVPTLPELNT